VSELEMAADKMLELQEKVNSANLNALELVNQLEEADKTIETL
jgi:hypothetical protein